MFRAPNDNFPQSNRGKGGRYTGLPQADHRATHKTTWATDSINSGKDRWDRNTRRSQSKGASEKCWEGVWGRDGAPLGPEEERENSPKASLASCPRAAERPLRSSLCSSRLTVAGCRRRQSAPGNADIALVLGNAQDARPARTMGSKVSRGRAQQRLSDKAERSRKTARELRDTSPVDAPGQRLHQFFSGGRDGSKHRNQALTTALLVAAHRITGVT